LTKTFGGGHVAFSWLVATEEAACPTIWSLAATERDSPHSGLLMRASAPDFSVGQWDSLEKIKKQPHASA
jgi:hypothetical protein